MYLLDGVSMVGWSLDGNDVDGDKVARLDARGGADGGEIGAGQDRNTKVMINYF